MKKSFLFAFCLLLILTACAPTASVSSEAPADTTPPRQSLRQIPLLKPLLLKITPLTVNGIPAAVRKAAGEAQAAQQYPLMPFMSDGATTGLGAKAQLTQGWGGLIWATEAEQAKHPCFVLVPSATVAFALDDYSTREEVDMIPRLIEELEGSTFFNISKQTTRKKEWAP